MQTYKTHLRFIIYSTTSEHIFSRDIQLDTTYSINIYDLLSRLNLDSNTCHLKL